LVGVCATCRVKEVGVNSLSGISKEHPLWVWPTVWLSPNWHLFIASPDWH